MSNGCSQCGVSEGIGKASGCVCSRVGGGNFRHGANVGGETLLFLLCTLPVSPKHRCGSIVIGVGPYQCTTLPCHGNPMFASDVVFRG